MARGVLNHAGVALPAYITEPRSARIDPRRFACEALDATVAYVGAGPLPPGLSTHETLPRGGVALVSRLHGVVGEVGPGHLVVEHGALRYQVRHLLPGCVDLAPLRGESVGLELRDELVAGSVTTDARLRDRTGRLLLWARDGAPPAHAPARLTLRLDGDQLVVSDTRGTHAMRAPSLMRLDTVDVLVLRAEAAGVAFVAVTR